MARSFNVLTVYYKHKPGGFCKRMDLSVRAYLDQGWEVHYVAVEAYPYNHSNLIPHILPSPFQTTQSLWFWMYFFLFSPWFVLFVGMKYRIRLLSSVSPLYAWVGLPLKVLTQIPGLTFIWSKPTFNTDCRDSLTILKWLESGLEAGGLYFSDQLLANSHGSRNAWIEAYGRLAERIDVLPNNMEDPPFDKTLQRKQLLDEFSLNSKSFIIATSGILEPHKNVELLTTAFSKISSRDPILLIIGEGQQRTELEILAESLDCKDRIVFTGWRSDVLALVQGADVFVLPSLREGMSEALLEATTCKIPCLISAIPESMEVIRNPEQHFDPTNAEELAMKLARCLEDPDYYQELVTATQNDKARYVFDWKTALIEKLNIK